MLLTYVQCTTCNISSCWWESEEDQSPRGRLYKKVLSETSRFKTWRCHQVLRCFYMSIFPLQYFLLKKIDGPNFYMWTATTTAKKKGTKRSEFVLHISSIGWQPWMFANILILHELGICVIEMYPACCWPYFCLLFRDLWLHACTSYIPENT